MNDNEIRWNNEHEARIAEAHSGLGLSGGLELSHSDVIRGAGTIVHWLYDKRRNQNHLDQM